jgi:hypothetical protein
MRARRSERIKAHWEEYRVTRQVRTGNGDRYLAQWGRAPSWFVLNELGYGWGEGPSVEWTEENVDAINRQHAAQFARENAEQRQVIEIKREWERPQSERKKLADYQRMMKAALAGARIRAKAANQ